MERFFKIYRIIGGWIPFICIIIGDELELGNSTKNWVWLILLIINAIMILISLKTDKDANKYEKVLAIIALIAAIIYLIFFILPRII